MHSFFKEIRYLLEFIIVKLSIYFFLALGDKASSNLGSLLARKIGKYHSTNNLALKNIGKSFPKLTAQEKAKIVDDMWDNLGRVIGEYPYVSRASGEEILQKYASVSQEDQKNIEFIKQNFRGGIIFSAHTGNWEIGPKILERLGVECATIYRPLNNKYVEKLTAKMRNSRLIAKGAKGSKQMIETIKNGGYIIILMDQKISEGEPVPFFFDEAITSTSIARIALKYDVPLIPARVIRVDRKFKFIAKFEKPIEFKRSDNANKDALDLTLVINRKLESWIEEYKSQWFWVHNRWKK